jgi:hypothetical protein
LNAKTDSRYSVKEIWESRIHDAIRRFAKEDIIALYQCVFDVVYKEELQSSITSSSSTTSYHSSSDDDGVAMLLHEDNCLDDEILKRAEPRIPLVQLHKQLVKVFKWIQSKDMSKKTVLRSLLSSKTFQHEEFRPKEIMSGLASQFQLIQNYEDIKYKQHSESNNTVLASCCWAQFLVMLNFACSKRIGTLCNIVFYIYILYVL